MIGELRFRTHRTMGEGRGTITLPVDGKFELPEHVTFYLWFVY